jgi:hypothetical protein
MEARMAGPDSGTWSQSSLQQNAEHLAYHSRSANGLPRALSERLCFICAGPCILKSSKSLLWTPGVPTLIGLVPSTEYSSRAIPPCLDALAVKCYAGKPCTDTQPPLPLLHYGLVLRQSVL